jgi:CDP-diacylglycerol---serine O-phosphatidyltransferase
MTAWRTSDSEPDDDDDAEELAFNDAIRTLRRQRRQKRRLRLRRRGKRAYIRSVYFLPSLCTLGNAVCGFASMYVAFLVVTKPMGEDETWWVAHGLAGASYLIFLAMLFDALDGRLARFARHTTDFGGQLDSLADVISFGAAPAFLMLLTFRESGPVDLPKVLHRAIWAIGALYVSCAALRLARYNVSNEHGEQYHFSFLGLPSPGAAAAVAGLVSMQQYLVGRAQWAADVCVGILPLVVLATGLLMISTIRYPHLINRYLRGKRPIGRLIAVVVGILVLIVAHQFAIGIFTVGYAFWGPINYGYWRLRRKSETLGQRPTA